MIELAKNSDLLRIDLNTLGALFGKQMILDSQNIGFDKPGSADDERH